MIAPKEPEQVFKIVLRYKGKDYTCEGTCWWDDFGDGTGEWRSPHEDDGVRTCEHDLACLLPHEVYLEKEDWPCEQTDIESIDYWFEPKVSP